MTRWLNNLSIAKKLYALVGIMVLLIAVEIVMLRYAMTILTTLRIFVQVAENWNDAQKSAIINLYSYALTYDEKFYVEYQKSLVGPAGFIRARKAMADCDDLSKCPELVEIAKQGFRDIKVSEEEVPDFIYRVRQMRGLPRMNNASNTWRKGDESYDDLVRVGKELRKEVTSHQPKRENIEKILRELGAINDGVTELRSKFGKGIGGASRIIEVILLVILIVAVSAVGSVGMYFIYRLVRYFNGRIEEVKDVAIKVGKGDFSHRIQFQSEDGLGQMIAGLNRMIEDLETNVGKREQAESANQVKSLFLANMSHEVRTPLGVIIGLIDILKDPLLSIEERQKYMGVIEQTGKNLQQIINDILDISKVEAGHLDIHKSTFDTEDFIEELILNLQLLAQRGRNRLNFEAIGPIPENIVSDRVRLRQILTNLIGNGLKFTHEGVVTVTYGIEGSVMYFRVRDTGIGIPEKERDRLFKPFSQVDHAYTRKYGGTGLGLLLSKRLAQSLGGDIQLESSTPGVGSVFTLTLPIHKEVRAPLPKPTFEEKPSEILDKLKGKRILLVEDSVDNQMLIQLFLGKKEAIIDCANNGQEGIDKASVNTYDLVIMDMQMPVVDGYTATEELRRRGYQVPIIALTAHAMKEDRERCLRVGCNDYMTKPIDPATFYHTLITHV